MSIIDEDSSARRGGPVCSVVIGARWAEHDPSDCLRALEPQVTPDVEIIVVDDGPNVTYPLWARRLVRCGALVPELWAAGLAACTGDRVGLLSGGVVPAPDWLGSAMRAGDEAALGGTIEPGPGMGAVDWAVYFCRYAQYLPPIGCRTDLYPAADNAVYRRDPLVRYQHLWEKGFWEPFVHHAMVRDGHTVIVREELRVALAPGARASAFARQRYQHGLSHGMRRSADVATATIMRNVLTAPLVPLVMTARAGREVFTKGRHRGRFVVSAPLVAWFYAWWAAGEAAGRLRAVRGTW